MLLLVTTVFIRATWLALVLPAGVICSDPFGKIIGGENAAYGEFRYQLSMENYYSVLDTDRVLEFYDPFCGATAISDSWALSAAHCVLQWGGPVSAEDVILRSGSLSQGENGIVHSVQKIIAHHKYNSDAHDESELDADISLIKVNEPFSINPYVKYVSLPPHEDRLKAGTLVTAAGWGITDPETGEQSVFLKKTVLAILDRKVCENLPHFRGRLLISKHMICAAANGSDAAPGDSGGPVVGVNGDTHTQVGVVSWGTGTGQLNDPGIYTKVSMFRLWIYIKTGL